MQLELPNQSPLITASVHLGEVKAGSDSYDSITKPSMFDAFLSPPAQSDISAFKYTV